MAERPRYPRSGCLVPFCRRTSTLFEREWLCADHWKLVPRELKRFRTQRLKAAYRAWEKAAAALDLANQKGEGAREAYFRQSRANRRWHGIERGTWRRMKRIAVEKATGL